MANVEPGELFAGRYKIVRRLGAGGMGAVYLACDPLEEDFLVALKVLNPGQAQNTTARERFRNEITASYKINHPHVVRAYEYFDAEDIQAYAMEYVDGGDLMERMNSGMPGIAESLDILTQTADALTAIHSAAIIHRDLKPENILLTKKGTVKITDFGVARLKEARTLTSAGTMVGTPKYLAPEYIEIGECDARGDIFALGVIAYELLSGEAPFGNESNPNKMLERLRTPAPDLKKRAANLPSGLSEVVMKAMETRVAKRYQTAAALLADLQAITAGAAPEVLREVTHPAPKPPDTAQLATSVPALHNSEGHAASGSQAAVRGAARPGPLSIISEELEQSEPASKRAGGFVATPAAHVLPIPSSSGPLSRRQRFTVGALLTVLVCSIGVAYRSFLPALTSLPIGQYTGQAFGLFGEGSLTPVGVVRSTNATIFVLGRIGCAPANLQGTGGTFACGDLTFDIVVEAITESSAVGTIRERSWQTLGTWSISRQ